MAIPVNITKEHLLRAIEQIDKEGVPSDAGSQYYDLLYLDKKYPPKLVVSLANLFANGEILDRNSFAGGLDTPCFNLLERNGFEIVPKDKINAMPNVKIYEVKASANDNFAVLKSKDGKHFYWNDAKFKYNEPGDYVFVINRSGNEALFTQISEKGIAATFDSGTNSSHFNDNQNLYNVRGEWDLFVRFDILETKNIPTGWNWVTQLRSSEVYDLWKPELVGQTNRSEKLDDLKEIFVDGDAREILESCRELLQGSISRLNLMPEIVSATKSKNVEELLGAHEFLYQLATEKVKELNTFHASPGTELYQQLIEQFEETKGSFIEFLNSFSPSSEEYKILKLIGEVIAYCDVNAANKKEFNQYPDKRTLALSFVRQTNWVQNLLKYKAANDDINSINSLSIRNAVSYLLSPDKELTMLAENHRKMVARYLLKTAYDKSSFVAELIRFFEPYKIIPVNQLNLTRIICEILYEFPNVKKLWFEIIEGLVVCDRPEGLEEAKEALQESTNIVLWWDKLPTGGEPTLKLLKQQIKDNGSFHIYYTKDHLAYCRSRVVDFATESDYGSLNWNHNGNVAWFQNDFKDYNSVKEDGRIRKARIAFLVDEIIKLKTPVSLEQFEFYREYQPPTQNNMQPFAELKAEVEAEILEEIISDESEVRASDPTISLIDFDHDHRQLLMAIKTKPLVLLAGISGTGKSRLARTLAYKSCALRELQLEKPENFLIIQVKPNWHDSTELLGYESGITGKREYIITPFIRFVVKAWKYSEVPFILCLDEMNLAPVEQYFAEYLSAIESREYKNGRLITDSLIPASIFRKYCSVSFWKDLEITEDKKLQDYVQKYGLSIPQNLVVVGTVNMDETTHSFSRKVLDRAMTIEMNEVNLRSKLDAENRDWEYPAQFYSPELINGVHTYGGQVFKLFDENSKVLSLLEAINQVLEKTPFKIAYRVRDEALIYCYHNSRLVQGDQDWINRALDEIVCMKILPRIEGDESKTQRVIIGLKEILKEEDFPISNSKLTEMQARLEFGYTTFWP